MHRALSVLAASALVACDGGSLGIDAAIADGGPRDAGRRDAGDAGEAPRLDASSPDAGPPPVCPPGSASLVLDLRGVALTRVEGVPIDDGFAEGFSIVEGPVWARGALYVSHFGGGPTPTSRVYRIDASGGVTIAAPSAGTNGLALSPDGRLHGGRHADGAIAVFDWDDLTAAPVPVVRTYDGARFNSPNDLVFRSDGTLYFTDPGWQAPTPAPQAAERAYRVAPGGAPEPIPGTPSRPNGIALSLDERTLFVTGTDGLRRYELSADGSIAAGPFDVPAVSGGLDGLGLDCAGNLYVTGGDRVRVLDRELRFVGELPAPGATNVAFGGDDRRTLYVTTLGSQAGLLSARLGVPGLPY
jgi:gluconolactonase